MQQERDTGTARYHPAPFAPHVCEELWDTLGHETSVCDAAWPAYNEEYLKEDTINYTTSFNGKARFNMEFDADAASDAIQLPY